MGQRYRPFNPFDGGPFEPGQYAGEFRIPRPPRRVWIALGFFAAALLILFLTSPVVTFITDAQWFSSLGRSGFFWTRYWTQVLLFAAGWLLATGLLTAAGGLGLAARHRPVRALNQARARNPAAFWLVLAGAAVVGLVFGAILAGTWEALQLFLNSAPSGVIEPLHGLDISFYLLQLPFLHALVTWLQVLTGLGLIVTLAVAGVRGQGFELRMEGRLLAATSIELGLLFLLVAAGAWLSRFDLAYQRHGLIAGAGFADVNVRLPLQGLETFIALGLAALLFANPLLRRPWLPAGAALAWVVVVLLGAVIPGIVQRLVVSPSELTQEQPYIQREIEGTRRAYGLGGVEVRQFNGEGAVKAEFVASDSVTIENLRLWDDRVVGQVYSQLQSIRTYYRFQNVDLDRYRLAGRYTQVELSARELDAGLLPEQARTWVNQRLIYTHGYGIAANPVNSVVGEGIPDFVAGGLPPEGILKPEQPSIYFGEVRDPSLRDDYVIAPSLQAEILYSSDKGELTSHYDGRLGVPLSGAGRLLWSLRLSDFNLLLSNQIAPDSQVLFRRNIQDRVAALAPFIDVDPDAYLVLSEGRLYWILDGYTRSSFYPYSAATSDGSLNYVRNSVKVVIDAYSGETQLYIADPHDPLVRAYARIFPGYFKPLDALSPDLRAHLRVPRRYFQIQAEIYRTYHILDAKTFYNKEDVWSFATEQVSPDQPASDLTPYYALIRLPGEMSAEYVQFVPFTPRGKQNMVAWLAARNDPPHYGELVAYVLPRDQAIFGPQQIASRIQQNPAISRDFTLLNQTGSKVIQGNLLVVPVGSSFLYFQPVYLRATGGQSLPELKKVILADSRSVAYQDTLQAALAELLGQAPPTGGGVPGGTGGTGGTAPAQQVADLVRQANAVYASAQEKLRAGDFAGYANDIAQLGKILSQLQSLAGGSAGASPAPSPSGSSSPRSSPSPATSTPSPRPSV